MSSASTIREKILSQNLQDAKFTRFDPLFNEETLVMDGFPEFNNGKKITEELYRKIDASEDLVKPLVADKPIIECFKEIFPSVFENNGIGEITDKEWTTWQSKNHIEICKDSTDLKLSPGYSYTDAKDIYVGGPATAVGAALQAQNGSDPKNVLYAHDGCRATSNWKGSANYHHMHDSIPVYYWPNNHGIYSVYATVKHCLQKKINPEQYKKEVSSIPQWCKIRWNVGNTLMTKDAFKNCKLLLKNQWESLKDVGVFIDGTELSKEEDTTAYTTIRHSGMSEEIFNQLTDIPADKPLLVTSDEHAKCTYVQLGSEEGLDWINSTFKRLDRVGGKYVTSFKNTKEEIAARGYPEDFVIQQSEFPLNGYFPPYVGDELEKLVTNKGGSVRDNLRLQKLYVNPTNQNCDDVKVVKAQFENVQTGETEIIPVKSVFMSLGPSMRELKVNDENILTHTMFAAGASTVFMVKIDESKIDAKNMLKFRDNIDMKNNHIVRLGERVVKDSKTDKTYRMFCLQVAGGGHFPAQYVHPEAAINTFKANTCQLFELDKKTEENAITYEICQVRSCARSVGSQNVMRLCMPASNASMLYGIGGIGMTTMAPNALMMKAALEERSKLASDDHKNYDLKDYQNNLLTGNFDKQIRHTRMDNPFKGRNYARWIDHTQNPQLVAPMLYPKTSKISVKPPNIINPLQMKNILRKLV